MLSIDEIKTAVSHSTGVPADLLDGETEEEIRARAAALRAFARDRQANPLPEKSTAELFAEWATGQLSYNMFNDPDGSRRVLGR